LHKTREPPVGEATSEGGDRQPSHPTLYAKLAAITRRYRFGAAIRRLARSVALREAAILGTGTAASQVILFLGAPLYLRLYQPASFGLYSFVYSTIGLLAALGTWKIERLIIVVPARATAIRILAALIAIAVVSAALIAILALPLRVAENTVPGL